MALWLSVTNSDFTCSVTVIITLPLSRIIHLCVCVRALQVLVRSDWSGDLYGTLLVDSDGSSISADLLLDENQRHVYVLTSSRVRQSLRLSVLLSVSLSLFFIE